MNKDWTGNYNSIFKTLGASNHTDNEREINDYYATDPATLEPLLKKEEINHKIWECACGEGHLSKKLEENGFEVKSTDLIYRGYGKGGIDFLNVTDKFDGDILTNPPYKCFDLETQCYTKKGWKFFYQLEETDEILSVNPITQLLEWSKIRKIIIRKFDSEKEKMYHFKTRYLDIMVTNNHRMWVFKEKTYKLQLKNNDLIHSEDIRSTHGFPQTGYKWKGKKIKKFVLPGIYGKEHAQPVYKKEVIIPMDDWLRFFGFWLADGYCSHTKNLAGYFRKIVGIKQSAQNADYVRNILGKLPFTYYEYLDKTKKNPCINFNIHNEQLWAYLKQFGTSKEKFIPEELKDLSVEQLNIFLDSYFNGDGSIYQENGRIYRTISKKLIEDVQELILKTGYLTHIASNKYNQGKKICYSISMMFNKENCHYFFPSNANDACKINYEGYVGCVNLEKNGVFLLRRNGKEFFCGNCAQEFVEHSLELIPEGNKVIMFLKLQFLEGQERRRLFDTMQLAKVYVFSKRQQCAKNGIFTGSSAVAYGWFVWIKGYHDLPKIEWIDDVKYEKDDRPTLFDL